MSSLRALPLLFALVLAGCSSSPDLEDDEAPLLSRTSELTVIIVSQHLQQPVPATGKLTSLADGTSRAVDTRATPGEGQRLIGLQPGRYRVAIEYRYLEGEGVQPVEGADALYLEPGAKRKLNVVVGDRKEDKLGSSYLPASTNQLPLESTPG